MEQQRSPLKVTRLIGRALEAARKALRDLETTQVPASLRPVVAHSGTLTPPLAALLARETDALPWLRERALEAWADADVAEGAPDRASALFLLRPPGWELDFALAAAALGATAAAPSGDRAKRALAAMEREVGAARDRERQARVRAESAEAEAREAKKRAGDPARSHRAEAARLARDFDRARGAWDAERAALESQVAAAEAGIVEARQTLFRAEQDRAAMARALEEARGGGMWVGGDPVGLGALLDEVAAQARAVPVATPEAELGGVSGFALSAGVRPDEPRAIGALLAHRGPLLVVVDGYNAGLMMAEGTPADIRDRMASVLERLAVLAPPTMRVTVVWDSSLGGDTHRRGRVEVRFAEAEEEADDVVVEIARDSPVPVVVISSDREVRDRAEGVGAAALWSESLVGWAAGRR